MATAVTQLANFGNTSSFVSSWTTGSLSIPANSYIILFAGGVKNNGDTTWDATSPFSVTDSVDGATGWAQVSGAWYWLAGTSGYWPFGTMWIKKFTSAVTRTITLSAGARSLQLGYDVVAVTGANLTTNPVQSKGAIVNPADNNNTQSQTVTFDAAPTTGNAVVWFLNANRTSTADAATIPSGLTSLVNPAVVYQPTAAAWANNVTATGYTCTDIGTGIYTACSAVIELAAASAGAPASAGGMFFGD